MAEAIELSIVIPVRNEGLNLKILLKILKAVVECSHETLVVFDTADDDSLPVIREMKKNTPHLEAVHNTLGKGVANALRAGINQAQGKYILIFAADEVGPVIAFEEMLTLARQGCDFISCTRYAHGGRRLGGSWIGGVLSRLANWLFCIFSGSALTDSTTGIKMFRKEIFQQFLLESKPIGWAVVFELAIKAQMAGLTLGEVPIISIDRLYGGKSTFRLVSWVREYSRWFAWGTWQLRFSEKRILTKPIVRIPKWH